MSPEYLTDEDRDALKDAAFDAFGDNPDGLNELVESLIQRHRAAVWDECFESGEPWNNPYRDDGDDA